MLEEMYDVWVRGAVPPPPYTDGAAGSSLPINAVLAGKYHLKKCPKFFAKILQLFISNKNVFLFFSGKSKLTAMY
jgi:hypothetical protein